MCKTPDLWLLRVQGLLWTCAAVKGYQLQRHHHPPQVVQAAQAPAAQCEALNAVAFHAEAFHAEVFHAEAFEAEALEVEAFNADEVRAGACAVQ